MFAIGLSTGWLLAVATRGDGGDGAFVTASHLLGESVRVVTPKPTYESSEWNRQSVS